VETGITIMQMDAGLDTGPVLLEEAIPISEKETAHSLHDRLAPLGAKLIVRALAESPVPRPQDSAAATYAAKIDKREAQIDWREPAEYNQRKVRAFNPVPIAATVYADVPLKIWKADVVRGDGVAPGTVLAADAGGITIACGDGALRITELQRAGGRRLRAGAFLAGCRIAPGERFG
jgi:methionyl-tRNA formyltransferase